MIEQLAVVVYGALTLIIAVVLAYMQHSVVGMALTFAAAGVTYTFQFIALLSISTKLEGLLIALVFILTIGSAIVSTVGY